MKKHFFISFSGESGSGKTSFRQRFSDWIQSNPDYRVVHHSIALLLKRLFYEKTGVGCFSQAEKASAFSHPDFSGARTVREGLVEYARHLKNTIGKYVFVEYVTALSVNEYIKDDPRTCFVLVDDIRADWEYRFFGDRFRNLNLNVEDWLFLLGEPSINPIVGDEEVISLFYLDTPRKILFPKLGTPNIQYLLEFFSKP